MRIDGVITARPSACRNLKRKYAENDKDRYSALSDPAYPCLYIPTAHLVLSCPNLKTSQWQSPWKHNLPDSIGLSILKRTAIRLRRIRWGFETTSKQISHPISGYRLFPIISGSADNCYQSAQQFQSLTGLPNFGGKEVLAGVGFSITRMDFHFPPRNRR